mgnify:CR=1 FL=1
MGLMILLPGLGADERMFENLGDLPFPLLVVRHLLPERKESLAHYALRTAESLGVTGDDMVGGSSFGRFVASEIARERLVLGLVLIGGALSSAELIVPCIARLLCLMPMRFVLPVLRSEAFFKKAFASEGEELQYLARAMMNEAPNELLYQGGRMLLRYFPDQEPSCPVYAIHGGLDPLMKPPLVTGCRLLPQAGHAIAWTHGRDVGAFLQEVWGTRPA